MCGICGVFSPSGGVERKEIEEMAATLTHRGPDDGGIFLQPRGLVGLGHRRLSILDLTSAGHQPMSSEDGRVTVVYNGEIYNHPELKRELEKKGHQYHSRTDTETIIHLYEEYGVEGIKKLNGMFAFALWDDKEERLILARDPVGIKPLYYYQRGERLAFASELKALYQLSWFTPEINYPALVFYLRLMYIPAPYTVFSGVYKLKPGWMVIADREGVKLEEYWNVQGGEQIDAAEEELARLLRETLQEAVARQLMSDVPVGAFLSGGIDSSIVVGLMKEAREGPVYTFSISFPGEKVFDESRDARLVARHFGTVHREFSIERIDLPELLPHLVEAFDEPFADSSAIAVYYLCQMTRREVKVALAGDGSDELFAGYRKYTGEYYYRLLRRWLPSPVLEALRLAAAMLPEGRGSPLMEGLRRVKKMARSLQDDLTGRYLALAEIATAADVVDLLPWFAREGEETGDYYRFFLESFPSSSLGKMMYCDFKTALPDDMLTKVDRMSMAHSLEVRVPFLDQKVVELAWKIPPELKLRGKETKYLLKRAFFSLLPPEILQKKKHGFDVPVGEWFRERYFPFWKENVKNGRICKDGVLSWPKAAAIMECHLSRRRDYGHLLWALLVLAAWWEKKM